MISFTTSSKPKVIYIGSKEIDDHTVEVIKLKEKEAYLIKSLDPDLIITDSDDISYLLNASYNIRKKWILYEDNLHARAVEASLIKDETLISIFTSMYNTGDKIIETYSSLVHQYYQNWEWVIVDDGRDYTSTIIRYISRLDPRVKIYSFEDKSNGNIGEAKYRAAMLCRGNILVELDHDDLLTKDCLSLIMKAFRSNNEVGFVYSDCVEYNMDDDTNIVYGKSLAFGLAHHYKYESYLPYTVAPLNQLTIRHIVSVPNHVRAWRSNVYYQLGGHNRDMRIADDYELIVRSFLHTKFMYIPKMLYIQRYDGNNSQNSNDNRNDIQLRVREIVSHYDKDITARFQELGVEDICSGMQAIEANNKIDKSKLITCNETFDFNSI